MSDTDPRRFTLPAVVLHWAMVVLIAATYLVGSIAEDMPGEAAAAWTMALHRSLGIAVLLGVVVRIAWRRTAGAPAPDRGLGEAERLMAAAVQVALYILMFAAPITGLAASWFGGAPVSFFGLFPLPAPAGLNRHLSHLFEEAHEATVSLILWLALAHTAAALWHHYVRQDEVLVRMLPWRSRRGI